MFRVSVLSGGIRTALQHLQRSTRLFHRSNGCCKCRSDSSSQRPRTRISFVLSPSSLGMQRGTRWRCRVTGPTFSVRNATTENADAPPLFLPLTVSYYLFCFPGFSEKAVSIDTWSSTDRVNVQRSRKSEIKNQSSRIPIRSFELFRLSMKRVNVEI